jgi:beta-glucosidase-like glycosyl hydrolase
MGITAMLQGCSKLPLLFSADAENGLSMKFSQVVDFPKNITLGSLPDVSLIEQMGRSVGRQMKECGIQVNFAPVVDVNTNPSNPIIGVRSFGENPHRVSQAALAYVRGLQSEGCVAVVKHFPGHGDTSQDSHTSLPFVSTTRERMDSVELLPFRTCIENGVMGVMSAHLNVPALDKTVKSTSVSRQVLEVLLREEMGFKGLVVSDAVNMDGLKIATAGTNVEAACLEGGTDVVEFSLDVESAINSVKEKIEKGVLTESEIDMKVRRVLAVKEWCAKYARQESGMRGQVNSLDAECLSDMIFKKSVTILQNNNLESRDVRIKTFGEWPEFAISQNDKENQIIWLLVDEKSISQYNEYIERLPSQSKIVVMYLGNPYKIKRMKIRDTDGFVVMYESTPRAKRVAQMYVIKRFEACGIMPVTVGKYKEGIN